MSSIDRIEALAEEIKRKKKKKDEEDSITKVERLADQIKSGDKHAFSNYMNDIGNTTVSTDDIAPVKEEEERTWFKGGAFSDGYNFGDITKTILGTTGDVVVGATKGIGNLAEGLVDLGTYGVAGVGSMFTDTTDIKEFAQRELVNEFLEPAEQFVDKSSILGDKADAIPQGLGYVGGILLTGGLGAGAGLGTAGVTALTTGTIGASAMGSGMSEAYRGGATDEEAVTYGVISGLAEAGSELIFGGLGKAVKATGLSHGLLNADDMLAKKISSKLSSQLAKNFAEFGVKAGAEGLEEVAAGTLQAIGKKVTYMKEEELLQLLDDENLFEQFVTGAVVSGMAQSGYVPAMTEGSLREANKTGRDFITGLTQNEQTVLDKAVEKEIAAKEKDGTKLTNKEKNKITEELQEDLQKGLIDTADIESVLGGETYTRLQNTKTEIEGIQKQVTELENKSFSEITVKEKEQLDSLREKLNTIKTTDIENQLQTEVLNKIGKDNFLQRSYYEKAQKSTPYKYEITEKTSEIAKKVYKTLEQAGANNHISTRNFAENMIKIGEDTGTNIIFVNNEQLKRHYSKTGASMIDGYVNKKGELVLNINSPKVFSKTVGHEIAHLFEGTKEGEVYRNTLKAYAELKGDYQAKVESMSELYKNVDANLENEVVADLTGDYFFNDLDFVTHLSTKQPNIFKKAYNYIKHLAKQLTAGSKEARQLEKVKYTFEQAYRSIQKNGQNADTKYSLADSKGRTLTKEQQEYFKDSKVRDENGNLLTMYHGTSNYGFTIFDYGSTKFGLFGQGFYFTDAQDVAESYREKGKGQNKGIYETYLNIKNPLDMDAKADAKWDSVKVDGELIERYLDVSKENATNEDYFKALKNYAEEMEMPRWEAHEFIAETIEGMGFDGLTHIGGGRFNKNDDTRHRVYVAFDPSQIKNVDNAKPTENPDIRYSLSDNQGRKLSKGQQEYFKDSKVRDEEGNLKVMYHGTPNAGFTVFDYESTQFGLFGHGFYFTDSAEVASGYAKDVVRKKIGGVYEVYLNIKNPMDMDAKADAKWNSVKLDGESIDNYLQVDKETATNEDYFRALQSYAEEIDYLTLVSETIFQMGFDGITHIGGGRFNKNDGTRHRVYIAFDSNQIKRVDNLNPTENPDIRYSLSDNKGRELSEGQQEFHKDNQLKDENGNLLTLYHGTRSDFTTFIPSKGGEFGPGIYLADREETAKWYSKYVSRGENEPKVIEVYAVMKNPYIINKIDYIKATERITPKTFMQRLIKKGYDGIIGIELNGYDKQYIVFNPNQIKNVDNLNPTDSDDTRYSLSEEGKLVDGKGNDVTLEASNTGNHNSLMAIHNLSKEKLKGILELRGFPVASIAVIDTDKNKFEKYGPISVLFDKNTIDPTNKENKVFASDVYSPRFPETVNEINKAGVKQVADLLEMSPSRFESTYENRSIEEVVDNLLREDHIIDKYLKSKNITVEPVYKEKNTSFEIERAGIQTKYLKNFLDSHKELKNGDIDLKQAAGKYASEIKQIYIDSLVDAGATIEDAQQLYEDFNLTDSIKFLIAVKSYKKIENSTQEGLEIDEYATKKLKLNHIDLYSDEYQNFVKDLISPAFGDKYIRNKQDRFTPSGNRRSFKQLYDAYTLENVVKAMKGNVRGGEGFYYTSGNIRSQLTPQFKSIAEIKANKGKLVSETQMEEIKKEIDSELENLSAIADGSDGGNGDYWAALYQIAGLKKITPDATRTILEDFGYFNIPNTLIDKTIEFLEKLKNAPTEYFEAKPQRAIGFDEVQAVVIPNNIGAEFKQQLTDAGLYVVEYDANIEGDRQAKINQFDDLKFSLSDSNEIAPKQRGQINSEDVKIQEAIAPIQQTINNLSDQLARLESNFKVSEPEYWIPENNEYEAIEPAPVKDGGAKMKRVKPDEGLQQEENEKIAKILEAEPKTENDRNNRKWAIIKANVFDKGLVFEDVSLKHKNRELMGKWDYTLTSEARGQNAIGQGHYEYDPISKSMKQVSKSLNDIRAEIENTGLATQFYEYIYHKHNVDRMSLEAKAQDKMKAILRTSEYSHKELLELANKRITKKTSEEDAKAIEKAKEYKALFDVKNKPVFGDSVTAQHSQEIVNQYEFSNPEFMDFAQDIYNYTNADRQELVKNGVVSQETADLWQEMYPHYVPIRRADKQGNAIDVPLDTGRTGVNAPIKRAKGGNSDILPLFDTLALRTLQTYRATAKNDFGVELMNTIGTRINTQKTTVDEVLDSVDAQEGLLQEGKGSQKPTFTVFKDGERITFEITKDMYDALKPLSESSLLSKTFGVPNAISSFHRGVLTEYNPVFMLTNAIKDTQDILINSQHPAKTYAKIPEAFTQLVNKGYWYQEYMNNGGEQNSYFDSMENTFKTENKGIKKLLDLPPLSTISKINNYIERVPRLAEYIASREAGRSVQVSMLDAARVTTNFKAGGNLTKFLNRNGATFLNASIQGAMQQVRNIREAKANGAKGWMNLATKFAVAGIPAVLLNALVWDDDEEYEELSDYIKQNYYIVGKTDEGKFIRIPKGRTLAVIQEAIQQISDVATGNDEADLKSFIELALTNLAPNNPIEDNILSPIVSVANNKTWYGDDLVPTRLQDLPAEEQFDESTDAFSKWLGGAINVSPVKINYLLDQYTGGVGDVILPMMTPKAESGAETLGEKLLAPLNNKFTADAVLNNQNVADFYDKSEELTTEAKKSKATDIDILSNKYMNSVKGDMNELYKEKRAIQNSSMSNSEKYERVREIQAEINEIAKTGLANYEGVKITGNYATVGDREYRANDDGEWIKVTDEQKAKQEKVSNNLGITAKDYWNNKDEYDYAYESPERYAISKAVTSDLETYKSYTKALYQLKSDKDEDGKSISGSRKEKVLDYINNLDIDYGAKIVLFKSEYPSADEYNNDIIDYLNSRDDISTEEMTTILTELGMKVDKNGNVFWD